MNNQLDLDFLESAKNIIRFLLLTIVACGFSFSLSASAFCDSTVVQRFRISYPINDTELHENYLDNKSALETIKQHFVNSPRIDSIVIYSYASPEGPFKLNTRLAKERGERARKYLLENMASMRDFPDSLIIIKSTAENWEGLMDMVHRYYPHKDKHEVIHLLSREDISNDKKKALLKKLNGGHPWRYIKAKILPNLRYATWVAEWVYVPDIPQDIPAVESIRSRAIAQNIGISPILPQQKISKVILGLKTNLLYDALSLANFSIEVPFYKDKMSVLYYHQFPWWTWGKADNEICSRFLSIGAEARWWFKPKGRLNGHFLGAYAESGKYDLQHKRSFCYQGEFYSAGLSYGYAMPIGRNLNLEFSISAGYASITYRGYTPSEDYEILWRDSENAGHLHYFGPTKAQVSLVIPIRVKTKGGNER